MPRSSGRNRKLDGEPRQAWLRGACHPSVSSEVTPRQETVDVAVQCAGGRSRENPLDRWGGAHTGIDRSLTLTADKGQEIAAHGARVGIPARCIVMGNDTGLASNDSRSQAEFVANARATRPDACACVERLKVALALVAAEADQPHPGSSDAPGQAFLALT